MSIDFNKPVQTRDGRKVRILATDAVGGQPVIALVMDNQSLEVVSRYSKDGSYLVSKPTGADLINVPERVERWVNVYGPSAGVGILNESRAGADEDAGSQRSAVIRITYEDGKPVAVALEDV